MRSGGSETPSSETIQGVRKDSVNSGWAMRGRDMSDLYDKIKEDLPFRKEWAGNAGFGFELP
jgi:hypothetical protein